MRIVIADDSVLILERLQQMLSPIEQLEIVGAFENGTETLEALRTLKPDLAILDIDMPGLSGLQVLSEICKEGKNLKFIILTLYASSYYQELAIHSGADYFFSKVNDFEKVGLLVREMIANDGTEISKRVIKPM
jgi:DNA-binding NarL/FixJ family response regulator